MFASPIHWRFILGQQKRRPAAPACGRQGEAGKTAALQVQTWFIVLDKIGPLTCLMEARGGRKVAWTGPLIWPSGKPLPKT